MDVAFENTFDISSYGGKLFKADPIQLGTTWEIPGVKAATPEGKEIEKMVKAMWTKEMDAFKKAKEKEYKEILAHTERALYATAQKKAPRATMVVAWLDLVSVGSGSQVVVGGCGACGRRPARWSTRSVVHGKPAGARSASSTNPQPGAAPISAWIAGTCFNKQGAMREHIGTIRTSIQRQSGSAAVAAGERGVGRGFA
jgi:hypothetical protein